MTKHAGEQEVQSLLASMRRLRGALEADDSDNLDDALAEHQASLDALKRVPGVAASARDEWAAELRSLESRVLELARHKREATRDELGQIRRARETIGRSGAREPTPRFVSRMA